jgi:hypothetical protein
MPNFGDQKVFVSGILHLPSVGERRKDAIGFCFACHVKREREAGKLSVSGEHPSDAITVAPA